MITKDLGMVTAYAYAVAGGYTGTEAEFTQLMADLAVVVDDFDNLSVNVTTLPAGSSATASYADGVLSLGIPKGDKGDKGNTGETGATPQLSIGTVTTTTEPSVTITGTAENPVLNFGLVKGDKGDTGEVSLADLSTLLPTDTASGSIASFPDGQSVIPALSVVADIEPIQSGSGTPSPDNIRPISGHDEVNVSVCGKNVWDEEWELGYYNNTNGGKANSNTCIRCKNKISVQPNTTYFFHSPNRYSLRFYDAQDGYLGRGDYASYAKDTEFTTPNGCYYVCFYMEDAYGTTYNHDISINYPSTDTSYHAYQGTTHTTSLGRTVYGGTLDVVSGVLTVTHGIVDLGTLTYQYNSTYSVFYAPNSASADLPTPSATNSGLCSAYKVSNNKALANWSNGEIYISPSQWSSTTKYVCVKDSRFTSPSDFTTAVTGQTLVYELATPTTIQLTPQEVQTLLGQNNIWNDCGDTNVTYKADVTKWVEKHLS